MAAGSSGAGIELQKELICAICLDYFNEPVILKCGHNFCKFCILMHWEENGGEDVGYQCPECRMIFNKISFTKNYLVKNLVDKLSGLECLKPCEQPAPSKRFQIDGKCDRHGEELKLYCHTDNKPICVVCRESRAHRHHDVAPVPEVLEDMKSELRLRLVELTWQKTVCTRVKAMDEQTKNEAKLKKLKLKEKIEEDVGSLVQFLLDEKDDLLEALDAEEGTVIGMIDDNLRWVETEVVAVDKHMAQIHNHIRGNTSFESITETYNNPLKVSPLISSVNCSGDWMNEFSGPHQLILWKRMMHVLHTMPQNLTLDPDTAHPNLAITDFDTKVEEVRTRSQEPDLPQRFTRFCGILATAQYSSGQHYWEVLNLIQSYVTLRVPLHVSYVFHSPGGAGGWQHFDLQSELRLTFVYDTATLWKDGIGSPPQAELQGVLYPTSMRINEQGRLVVNFKTKARFRGLFVEAHSEGRIKSTASSLSSMVMYEDNPGLTFNLSLVRSEPTYNQPVQQWIFTSDFAVRDYSGPYRVNLIPCTTGQNMEYTVPPVCNPGEPVPFHLDIRFQQVSEPVSVEFSLNTQIFLLSKRNLWLSDGSMGFGQESDVAFSEGDTIYGLVMVDPVQNLGHSFFCNIEKVYLCTGVDGYVPKYNPTNFEFGCLAESPSLLYHFKILDKAQPETQARGFGDVDFNAMLAVDDPSALSLVRQPGTDGFRLDSTAMFQVAAGREWFIHTIYTIRPKDNDNHGIGKRSLEYHHSLVATGNDLSITPGVKGQGQGVRWSASGLVGAAVPDVADDIGADNNRGTNIMHIALDRTKRRAAGGVELYADRLEPRELSRGEGDEGLPTVVGGLVGMLLTFLLIIILVLVVRYRQKEESKERVWGSASTEGMMVARMDDCSNSSEV